MIHVTTRAGQLRINMTGLKLCMKTPFMCRAWLLRDRNIKGYKIAAHKTFITESQLNCMPAACHCLQNRVVLITTANVTRPTRHETCQV